MCGIAGYFSVHDEYLNDSDVIMSMTDAVIHRGPDDVGVWLNRRDGIAFGHRRLSIIDLSPAGHQPMESFCGRYRAVFNGEIYNFIELRRELEKMNLPPWKGHSDTEVMLACFSIWGIEATLLKLNGMFACALFDHQERSLTLFRDRMGKKPLYYGYQGNTFLFGSELKSLRRHPSFRGDIDRNALALFLRHNYIPEPLSIYQGIYKLPHATFIRLTRDDLVSSILPVPIEYWSQEKIISAASPMRRIATEEAVEQLEFHLRDAVKKRMIADVPVGVFLSGGIDSTLITAIMQKESSRPVQSFTIGFHDPSYDEAAAAKAVARHLNTDHCELYCSPEDALAVIPKLPFIYDEPFADSSQIPTYLVSQLAKRRVTVALTGDGGDELFGGYNRYRDAQMLYNRLKLIPRALRLFLLQNLPRMINHSMIIHSRTRENMAGAYTIVDRALKILEIFDFRDHIDFYRNIFLSHWKNPEHIVLHSREPLIFFHDASTYVRKKYFYEQMMYLDTRHYLPDDILVKVDRASMAVSLETRAPLLDYRIFEFAWQLPIDMKIRKGTGKWILRQLLSKYIPAELFTRPKKGFGVPIAEWLRGPLQEWAEALLDPSRLSQEGYFEPHAVQTAWREHLSGKRNYCYQLWDILMFQAWHESQTQLRPA